MAAALTLALLLPCSLLLLGTVGIPRYPVSCVPRKGYGGSLFSSEHHSTSRRKMTECSAGVPPKHTLCLPSMYKKGLPGDWAVTHDSSCRMSVKPDSCVSPMAEGKQRGRQDCAIFIPALAGCANPESNGLRSGVFSVFMPVTHS